MRGRAFLLFLFLFRLFFWAASLPDSEIEGLRNLCLLMPPANPKWNCSDCSNACANRATWPEIQCDSSNATLVSMYDIFPELSLCPMSAVGWSLLKDSLSAIILLYGTFGYHRPICHYVVIYNGIRRGPFSSQLSDCVCSILNKSIGYYSMTGPIPAEGGNLTNLTRLWLINNGLSGSIPPEMGKLSKLVDLNLGTNSFVGSIPFEFSLWTQLRYLHLDNSGITGNIPESLGVLQHLDDLRLDRTALSGCLDVSSMKLNTSFCKIPGTACWVSSTNSTCGGSRCSTSTVCPSLPTPSPANTCAGSAPSTNFSCQNGVWTLSSGVNASLGTNRFLSSSVGNFLFY